MECDQLMGHCSFGFEFGTDDNDGYLFPTSDVLIRPNNSFSLNPSYNGYVNGWFGPSSSGTSLALFSRDNEKNSYPAVSGPSVFDPLPENGATQPPPPPPLPQPPLPQPPLLLPQPWPPVAYGVTPLATAPIQSSVEQLQLGVLGGNDQPQVQGNQQVGYNFDVFQQAYSSCQNSGPLCAAAPYTTQLAPPHTFDPPALGVEQTYFSPQPQHELRSNPHPHNPVGLFNSLEGIEVALLSERMQPTLNRYLNSTQNFVWSTNVSSQLVDREPRKDQSSYQVGTAFMSPVVMVALQPYPPTVGFTQQFGVVQPNHLHEVNIFDTNQLNCQKEDVHANQHLQPNQWIESLNQESAWSVHQPVLNFSNCHSDMQGSLYQTSLSCQNPVEAATGTSYLINSEQTPRLPSNQNTYNSSSSLGPQQVSHGLRLNEVQMTFNTSSTQGRSSNGAGTSTVSRPQLSLDHQNFCLNSATSSSQNSFQPLTLSRIQEFLNRQPIHVRMTPNAISMQQQQNPAPPESRPSSLSNRQHFNPDPAACTSVDPQNQSSEMPELSTPRVQDFFDHQPNQVKASPKEIGFLQQNRVLPESPRIQDFSNSQFNQEQTLANEAGLLQWDSMPSESPSLSRPQDVEKSAALGVSIQGTPQQSQLPNSHTPQDFANTTGQLLTPPRESSSNCSSMQRKAAEQGPSPLSSSRSKLHKVKVSVSESQGTGRYDHLVLRFSNLRPLCNASYDRKFEDLNVSIDPHLRMLA